jgi:hypothetical protein
MNSVSLMLSAGIALCDLQIWQAHWHYGPWAGRTWRARAGPLLPQSRVFAR